jgi:hypothetical protein
MFTLKNIPISPDAEFTDANGIGRPPGWIRQATVAERISAGVIEVEDPVLEDSRYYWNGDINLPKDLAGLKLQFIAQAKDTAGKSLAQTDWMFIRRLERGIDVPSDVVVYRDAVVEEATRLEAAIAECESVEELIAVLGEQNWPTTGDKV